jgi:hypothetical protein
VMVKADCGGGGRGMRMVANDADLEEALSRCVRFGLCVWCVHARVGVCARLCTFVWWYFVCDSALVRVWCNVVCLRVCPCRWTGCVSGVPTNLPPPLPPHTLLSQVSVRGPGLLRQQRRVH